MNIIGLSLNFSEKRLTLELYISKIYKDFALGQHFKFVEL
jgi:hypothetical protein